MLSYLLSSVLAAGSYQVESGAAQVTAVSGGEEATCHRVEPREVLVISGPAEGELLFFIDARGKRKPRPLKVVLELDGEKKTHRLKAKKDRKAAYEPALEWTPSKPTKPIPISVDEGSHQLVIELPRKRTACVEVIGIAFATVDASDATASAPAESEAPPVEGTAGEAPETDVVAEEAATAPAETPPVAAVEPADPEMAQPEASASETETVVASAESESGGEIHEIRASSLAEEAPSTTETVEPSVSAAGETLLRIGPKAGGVLPRGDLQPTFFVGLLVDMPLVRLGGPEISAYFEGGWAPMRQADTVLVPGRGRAELIQNTLVIPLEVGARLRLDLGAGITPQLAVGFAADIVRSRLQVFSRPEVERNDIAFGVATAIGASIPTTIGEILIEGRYREVSTDLGELQEVGEPTLANMAIHLGFLVAL